MGKKRSKMGWRQHTEDAESGPTDNNHNVVMGLVPLTEYQRIYEVSDKSHMTVTHIRTSPTEKGFIFAYLESAVLTFNYDFGWAE